MVIDILSFAKGGKNNPKRRRIKHSNSNGRKWKFKKQHAYKDYDKDGKVNRYDCKPLNPKKQDLRISPTKEKESIARTLVGADDIYLSGKSGLTQEQLERAMPSIISHEELHKTLGKEGHKTASATLDNITTPMFSKHDEGITEADKLLHPKEVAKRFSTRPNSILEQIRTERILEEQKERMETLKRGMKHKEANKALEEIKEMEK